MRIRIYSYSVYSEGAKLLSEKLGAKVLKHAGSKFVAKMSDVVINWGAGSIPAQLRNASVLNDPSNTQRVSNKKVYYDYINVHNLPFRSITMTDNLIKAKSWVEEGKTVFCRTLVNSSEGRGIVVAKRVEELVQAPLYSLYQPKEREYRVHVFRGEAITVQQKLRRRQEEPVDRDVFMIRNTANGFRFCTVEDAPKDVIDQAIAAVKYFDLDFGGVDVIYKEARHAADAKAYVVEINSAPGVESKTAEIYAKAFKKLLGI